MNRYEKADKERDAHIAWVQARQDAGHPNPWGWFQGGPEKLMKQEKREKLLEPIKRLLGAATPPAPRKDWSKSAADRAQEKPAPRPTLARDRDRER